MRPIRSLTRLRLRPGPRPSRPEPTPRLYSTTPPSPPSSTPSSQQQQQQQQQQQLPRRTILSGIQPTGIPHLGNYFGALTSWLHLQRTANPSDRLLFFLADLHALTARPAASELIRWRRETVAALMAIGIGQPSAASSYPTATPTATTGTTTGTTTATTPAISLFCQSQVPAHAELNWILACHASVGYLGRMTQWKSKLASAIESRPSPSSQSPPPSSSSPSSQSTSTSASTAYDPADLLNPNSGDPTASTALRLGLFAYPVLQAADVLVHRATHVPVGPDQAQHLELARELALGFNNAVGADVLVPPDTVLPSHHRRESSPLSSSLSSPSSGSSIQDEGRDEGEDSPTRIKIKSLSDPSKKMSKSQGPDRSRIFITDDATTIVKKIRSAVTDSLSGPITYDPLRRPAVANLIDLAVLARNAELERQFTTRFVDISRFNDGQDGQGQARPDLFDPRSFVAAEIPESMTLGGLKTMVAAQLVDHLAPVRERYFDLLETRHGRDRMADVIRVGGGEANESANAVIRSVRDAIGMGDI